MILLDYILASYMTRFSRRLLLPAAAGTEKADIPDPDGTRMLYIHIPFCRELCSFCTFNRIKFERGTAERYFDNLDTELRMYREKGYRFSSIYIGGGTPTVLPERLGKTIQTARDFWDIREVSVETNPSDLVPETTGILKTAGVNRLSVGIQTFDAALLESINRAERHGGAADLERRLGSLAGSFDTVNIDLIFGLDGQTREQVLNDIETIKRLGVDQVTCYPLMKYEHKLPGFFTWRPAAAWERDVYGALRDALLPEYTPSSAWCFSKNSGMIDEYIVEHPTYAGAGSGAFGYLGGSLVANDFSVPGYMAAAGTGTPPVMLQRPFAPGESMRYRLLMQLFGGRIDIREILDSVEGVSRISLFFYHLLLRLSGSVRTAADGGETVTPKGAYRSVLLMKYFFQGVSGLREYCRTLSESPDT